GCRRHAAELGPAVACGPTRPRWEGPGRSEVGERGVAGGGAEHGAVEIVQNRAFSGPAAQTPEASSAYRPPVPFPVGLPTRPHQHRAVARMNLPVPLEPSWNPPGDGLRPRDS